MIDPVLLRAVNKANKSKSQQDLPLSPSNSGEQKVSNLVNNPGQGQSSQTTNNLPTDYQPVIHKSLDRPNSATHALRLHPADARFLKGWYKLGHTHRSSDHRKSPAVCLKDTLTPYGRACVIAYSEGWYLHTKKTMRKAVAAYIHSVMHLAPGQSPFDGSTLPTLPVVYEDPRHPTERVDSGPNLKPEPVRSVPENQSHSSTATHAQRAGPKSKPLRPQRRMART